MTKRNNNKLFLGLFVVLALVCAYFLMPFNFFDLTNLDSSNLTIKGKALSSVAYVSPESLVKNPEVYLNKKIKVINADLGSETPWSDIASELPLTILIKQPDNSYLKFPYAYKINPLCDVADLTGIVKEKIITKNFEPTQKFNVFYLDVEEVVCQ